MPILLFFLQCVVELSLVAVLHQDVVVTLVIEERKELDHVVMSQRLVYVDLCP